MKKSFKRAILFTLELGGFFIGELIAIASSPYGSSESNINRRSEEVMDIMFGHLPSGTDKFEEKSVRNVIYNLKKDGFIEYEKTSKGRKITITNKGKKLVSKVKRNILPPTRYKDKDSKDSKSLKIIIFDIPEKERRKRAWLRSAITNLGFKQLQQSVWAGNKAIPKSFLKDLKDLRILKFVEIFSIDKLGTIKPIKFES